jgi:hypothetical protein
MLSELSKREVNGCVSIDWASLYPPSPSLRLKPNHLGLFLMFETRMCSVVVEEG